MTQCVVEHHRCSNYMEARVYQAPWYPLVCLCSYTKNTHELTELLSMLMVIVVMTAPSLYKKCGVQRGCRRPTLLDMVTSAQL